MSAILLNNKDICDKAKELGLEIRPTKDGFDIYDKSTKQLLGPYEVKL